MFPASYFIPRFLICIISCGLPRWLSGKEFSCQCKRQVRKILWRRKWQPTPVFLPGKSHGAWWATVHGVTKESDVTEWLNNNPVISCASYTISLNYIGKLYFTVLTCSVSSWLSLFERLPVLTILHCLPRLTHICQQSSAFSWGNIVIPGTQGNPITDVIENCGPMLFLLMRRRKEPRPRRYDLDLIPTFGDSWGCDIR